MIKYKMQFFKEDGKAFTECCGILEFQYRKACRPVNYHNRSKVKYNILPPTPKI